MYIDVNGESTFIATGGKPFAAELPTVVMLHGSSLDHTDAGHYRHVGLPFMAIVSLLQTCPAIVCLKVKH